MDSKNISNYSVTETLRDGRQVTIRAIRPDDKGHIAQALKELSSESFYRRLFSPKRDLTVADLKQLTEVDFVNIVALVAEMREEEQDRIVGGGRYIRTSESGDALKAEVAFLIGDTHQGFGIGSRIFKHLIIIARASGIMQFDAEVLPTNDGMIRLFTNSGMPVYKKATRDVVHVTIDLTEQ